MVKKPFYGFVARAGETSPGAGGERGGSRRSGADADRTRHPGAAQAALGRQRPLIGSFRRFRGFALCVAGSVDRGAILGADVIALAHALGRVMVFPERLQQLLV